MSSKSARTRERVLVAAAEVLAERGYAGATLEGIAEQAGLKAGSLYYHFSSKDDLVGRVLEAGVSAARVAVEAATAALGPDADPVERIAVAIRAHMDAILAQGSFTTAHIRGYGQVPEPVADRLRTAQRAYGDVWRALIADAVRAGGIRDDLDETVVRLLLLGSMNWTVEWMAVEGPMDSRALADQLIAVAMQGLLPRRTS